MTIIETVFICNFFVIEQEHCGGRKKN